MNAHLEPSVLASLRHALSHVLAEAIIDLIPGTLLGPVESSDDGFHADFAVPRPLSSDDFPELMRRMQARLAAPLSLVHERVPLEQVAEQLRAQGELYQLEEVLARAGSCESVQCVRSAGRVHVCDDPSPCEFPAAAQGGFELRSVGGAYFRGDARNVMMARVHVWAFASAADLEAHREQYERAAARDHKKLGRKLELFAFDDEIGAGLPLWLPNGTAIRDELEKLMRELEFAAGFERVATPHVAHEQLYWRTGHLPYFADGMFPLMRRAGDDGPAFALRPMNCPHHHRIFAARRRSYRELPLRISEYGHVYRYEDSGAVSGLLRTRCMCMNDGHIYCSREQVVPELHAVLDMHREVYELLGLSDYRVRLSTHGSANDKFVDDPAGWAEAEGILRQVLEARGIDHYEGPGEAAFYGPKIDFQFRMVTGREETASTLQLDFAVASRLDLSYIGPGGDAQRPFILHRAPLGTHERFVALLIERYAGAFPTWLAPVQARVLPVSDEYEPYAREVERVLRSAQIRVQVEPAEHSLGKRVRRASVQKVPNVLVVGERERADRSVSLRRYGTGAQEALPLGAARERIVAAIASRARDAG